MNYCVNCKYCKSRYDTYGSHIFDECLFSNKINPVTGQTITTICQNVRKENIPCEYYVENPPKLFWIEKIINKIKLW